MAKVQVVPASEVFAKTYGDYKDKANLMRAMHRAQAKVECKADGLVEMKATWRALGNRPLGDVTLARHT